MTSITLPLAAHGIDRPPDLGQCERTMERTRRVRSGRGGVRHERAWSRPCPNRASVLVRGRAHCRQHAPAHAARQHDVSQERA